MIPMTGEIGTFSIDGEQVGGFKYWTASHNRNTGQTRVIASQFWLFEKPTPELTADFYYEEDEQLKPIYTRKVKVDFPNDVDSPDFEFNKKITEVIEMDLGRFDWLQGTVR